MKSIFTLALMAFIHFANAQTCNLAMAKNALIPAVDKSDLECIAKTSAKRNTLFFTFGVWCHPCREHFPNAYEFSKKHDTDFYVVLVDPENDPRTYDAVDYFKKIDPAIKVVVVKDSVYGSKLNRRNKKFVAEMTPPEFENIDCYSKHFLMNKEGKVVFVSSWKDLNPKNWKDDSAALVKMEGLLEKERAAAETAAP